jgi:hypothetical protein
MKFIIKSQSFQGGDFFYSAIKVEDCISEGDTVFEKHLFWHDDRVYIENNRTDVLFLRRVFNELGLMQFGLTNSENYNGPIIKNYSDEDDIQLIIPFKDAKSSILF